ncbi:phage integrase SAM-like domain-containing protein [Bacteroides thetaiotaomicron]|uniref:phage integrase SAM-like domain-containing protein n=1 Tax=Bacteroides thetaiotaomicron TaxID=818 RepID=UPI00356AE61A
MISFIKRNDVANAQGLYAVRLRICKERQRRYFSLNIFADSEYWDEENECFRILKNVRDKKQKEENEKRKQYNYLLNSYRLQAQEIIDSFRREHIDWTLNQFADAFLNKSKQGKIKAYMEDHINILRETGHVGNANCYAATLNMLEHYDSKLDKKVFSEIDIKFVNGFDIYLQKRGCKGNTRKYYFKALRSILNKAIQEKEATEKTYPFGKGGFQIAKLDEETEKRYLPVEYLNKIKKTVSEKPQREYARKLFLLSYYCYGISFIDMAYLTRSNIVKFNGGEYIVYKRHKIQHQKGVKPIKIKITKEIEHLLDSLIESSPTVDDFIVPIVSISGYTGEKLYNHIRYRYKKYNDYLAELAEELQITDMKLTTYVSRHTMAMMLQRNDVSREQISQMLGHADMKTTNTYLDSFDTTVIDEAAKVLYDV